MPALGNATRVSGPSVTELAGASTLTPRTLLGAVGVLCAAAVDSGSVFASPLHPLLTVLGDVQGCSQCSGADNCTSHTALFSSSCSHACSACSSPLAKRPPHRRSVLRSVPAV